MLKTERNNRRLSATGKALMAAACFTFAGVKLAELLDSTGQHTTRSLLFLVIFTCFGLLYLFLFWKAYKRPKA